jgi:hypothetical protein
MSAVAEPETPREAIQRVFEDFEWFCENCLKVPDRRTLRPVPLILKPAQRRLAKHLIQCLNDGTPIRVIILKARRHGMSTLVQAFFFWQCATRSYQHSLTIAHDQMTTRYLHGITERYYRHMPRWCRPMKDSSARGSLLEFRNPAKREDVKDKEPGLESSMQTTSLENAGAGFGILWLHLSEVARDPWCTERGSEALTTALQTVPHEPNTAVIIESTAQGVGNNFHEMWLQAEANKSDYLAFFAPWWEEPTYIARVPADFERTKEEGELAELAARSGSVLTDAQLQWRRLTIANECRGKLDQFHQEYPSTPREAFLTSGRPFFDLESVEHHARLADINPPLAVGDVITRYSYGVPYVHFERNRYGSLQLWEEPVEDEQYLIFSDCAAGTDEGGDYQAAYVLPRSRMVIVGAWHGLVDRDLFADNLLRLGYLYNKALIAVEVTGGWGASVITSLKKDSYPNLYRSRPDGKHRRRDRSQRYGWETTQASRAEMLDALEQALREDDLVCNDRQLLAECYTFTYGAGGKPQAQVGCHDDRVMAAAGAVYLWLHEPRRHLRQDPDLVRPWQPLSSAAGY